MSAMLEQAIIDAEQLKEAAKKTAEETVVEKYQDEIKEAVEKILEQEDDLGEMGMAPTSDGDLEFVEFVEDLPSVQTTPDDEIVEINLDKLEEIMAAEIEKDGLDVSEMLSREKIAEELTEDEEVEIDEEALLELADEPEEEEEIQLDETDLAAAIMEMLSEEEDAISDSADDEPLEEDASPCGEGEKEMPDGKCVPASPTDLGREVGRDPFTELQKETKLLNKTNASLLKEQTRTDKKVQLLKEKVDKYGTVINKLKNKLNESNLTNAKLLYQNRILNSASLNERQKDKIVDAISNATTVEEAKIIFETLQSAVGSFIKNKAPQSLREVVSRSSSAFIPRKEVQPKADVFSERMKRLAGLK